MDDAAAKYQKLAAAYTELKAKNAVLKEAVLASQAAAAPPPPPPVTAPTGPSAQQFAALQAALREKDQALRSLTQETETLRFQAQQLTRRVEVLQEAADDKSRAKSKPKSKQSELEDTLALQTEELQRQLQATEAVRARAAAQEKLHAQQLEAATQQAQEAQGQLERTRTELTRLREATGSQLAASQQQLQQQRQLVEDLQQQARVLQERSDEFARKAAATEQSLTQRVAELEARVSGANAFCDSSDPVLNRLNLPTVDVKGSRSLADFCDEALRQVRQLLASFASFCAHLDERARNSKTPAGVDAAHAAAYCELLSTQALHSRPVGKALAALQDGTGDLTQLARDVAVLAGFLARIAVAQQQQLTLEASSVAPGLQAVNASLARTLAALAGGEEAPAPGVPPPLLRQLSAALEAFADTCSQAALAALVGLLDNIHQLFKSMASQYGSKLAFEAPPVGDASPTANSLRAANGGLSSSLATFTMALARLTQLLREHAAEAVRLGKAGSAGGGGGTGADLRAVHARLHVRAAALQARVAEGLARAGPAPSLAVTTVSAAASPADDPAAHKMRVAQLEADREHLALEVQLLTLKLAKQQPAPTSTAAAASAPSVPSSPDDTDAQPPMAPAGADFARRESLIRQHFATRVAELRAQLNYADSKAVAFYEECRALVLRLDRAEHVAQRGVQDLQASEAVVRALQQELDTTRASYDEQLAAMSEHLMAVQEEAMLARHDGGGGQALLPGQTAPPAKKGSRWR